MADLRAGSSGPAGALPIVADSDTLEPRDPTAAELGRRIRVLRVTRGLTLKELEQRGGISATHISEIERGRASPTVGALARIAKALGLSPAALVEPEVLPDVAVRRVNGPVRSVQLGPAEVEPLGGCVREGSLGAHLVTLPARSGPMTEHRHAGEEWVLVLEGAVEARVGLEAWLLREGDSFHLRSHQPHSYANRTSGPAVLLVASRPGFTLRGSV
jgi:transcriptional regulator with XRE-family HTH domain